jgi:histidinol phosphatase-like enzyme (inositol monophosphatase family)
LASTANLVTCLRMAIELAETSREMIGRSLVDGAFRHGDATLKEDRSFVTATDAAVEARLREIISRRFPDHGVIGEEHGEHGRGCSHVWVLDPIDGTAAFMAGIPVFGSLIACCVDGDPVIGVMDFPALGARFVGVAGEPTRLNGNVLKTRPCAELAGAILSASSPDFFPPGDIQAFERLRSRTAWRIYGAAALAYGRLAQGRIDLSIDSGLKIWDIAAFAPIVSGAGGRITDWAGAPLTIDSGPRVLAAGDPAMHAVALELLGREDAAKRRAGT